MWNSNAEKKKKPPTGLLNVCVVRLECLHGDGAEVRVFNMRYGSHSLYVPLSPPEWHMCSSSIHSDFKQLVLSNGLWCIWDTQRASHGWVSLQRCYVWNDGKNKQAQIWASQGCKSLMWVLVTGRINDMTVLEKKKNHIFSLWFMCTMSGRPQHWL